MVSTSSLVNDLQHGGQPISARRSTNTSVLTPADVIARGVDDSSLNAADRALRRYSVKLTGMPDRVEERDVAVLRAAGFADEDILLANLIVAYFNFVNRIALGLGVTFDEAEMRGYRNDGTNGCTA